MEWIADPQAWIGLATLTLLEIVLGIDNIIFLSILVGRLPPEQRQRARSLGLGAAVLSRLALLFSIVWVMRLTAPLFTVAGQELSGRDLILIGGGLFLLWKSVMEIHGALEGEEDEAHEAGARSAKFWPVVAQIGIIDIVFSLDSVITAVGMARAIEVMIAAVVIAVLVMLVFAGAISAFIERHPTVKMLALSFLLLIGVVLIADGLGQHVSKGYIYFAMAFSVFVEMINLRVRAGSAPVHLHQKGP